MLRFILATFLSRIGSAILNFGVIILLSRTLGPEAKGICTRLLVIVASIQILCDLLGGAALVYLSPRFSLKNLIIPAWSWAFICSLLVPTLLILAFPELIYPFNWYVCGLAFLSSTFNQHIHLLNGREKYPQSNLLSFSQSFLNAIFLFAIIQVEKSPFAYLLSLYLAGGIVWIWSIVLLKNAARSLPVVHWKAPVKALSKYGILNQLGHILQFGNQRLAFLFLSAAGLGIYSNSVSLAESIWMVASSIAVIQYGKISNMKDKTMAHGFTLQLFRATSLLTFLICVVIYFVPESFYLILFGGGFAGVKTNLVILLPGVVMISGYLILGHYFSGTGQFVKNNLAIGSGLILTILMLGFQYLQSGNPPSATFIATTTSLANAVIFISVIIQFRKETGVDWQAFIPQKSDFYKLKTILRIPEKKR